MAFGRDREKRENGGRGGGKVEEKGEFISLTHVFFSFFLGQLTRLCFSCFSVLEVTLDTLLTTTLFILGSLSGLGCLFLASGLGSCGNLMHLAIEDLVGFRWLLLARLLRPCCPLRLVWVRMRVNEMALFVCCASCARCSGGVSVRTLRSGGGGGCIRALGILM